MTITPAAMQVLLTYAWPGNVRQLRDALQWASAVAPDDCVEPLDLPDDLGGAKPSGTTGKHLAMAPAEEVPTTFRPIQDEIAELEKLRMIQALRAADGVKTKAAALIEMPVRTFTHKLKQYKL